MIDFATQPLVKRAVARLETKAGVVGTGYLVSSNRLATCHHVVSEIAAGEPVTCSFDDLGLVRNGYLVSRESSTDSALLRFDEAVSTTPLELLVGELPATFWIHGFPHFTEKIPVSLEGRLTDPDTLAPGGIRAFALFSPQFAGRTPESIGGFSGSPVLAGGRVVGHMSSVLGSREARKAPNFGYAFAVRATGVRELFTGGSSSGVAMSAPPTSDARALDLTDLFNEIDCSTNSREIRGALSRASQLITNHARLFAAERMLAVGAANDAKALLDQIPASDRRNQLEALAMSLLGNHAAALAILRRLPASSEGTGIEGGTLKRRWFQTKSTQWLVAAEAAYSSAYAIEKDPYPGINAAACKLWLGDKSGSQTIAVEVETALLAKGTRSPWEEASLAEAHLLAGKLPEARARFMTVARSVAAQARSLATIRRQVRLELRDLGHEPQLFDDVFSIPNVAAFTGHRVDPDEGRGRFPPSRVAAVRERISQTLSSRNIRSGYSSAASGGDIMFIDALLEAGGEPHVYLPFPVDAFIETSVDDPWKPRFREIITRLSGNVIVLSGIVPEDKDEAYRMCNQTIQSAAHAEASLFDEAAILVAVVSSDAQPAPGNSADMVATWKTGPGGEVVSIDPR